MLFQPYGRTLTVGQIREYLQDYPDHAPVELAGGDDWSDGHELYTIKPKELYMPSQDSLSRRLGPVFAEAAAWEAMAELAAESQRTYPEGWGTSPRPAPKSAANPQMAAIKVPAKAYKPTHGGYPG